MREQGRASAPACSEASMPRRPWRGCRLANRPLQQRPLPKPRPVARNVVPQAVTAAPTPSAQHVPSASEAPSRSSPPPASTRAAAPPKQATARPRSPRPSSTSQADTRRARKRHRARAQAQAGRRHAVAQTRSPIPSRESSPNGSSCAATTTAHRSSAIAPSSSANPSWPSQTFLRRRAEAALWDDQARRRRGAGRGSTTNTPISAKGSFALAKALLARGDRANAERLVRDAWRSDPMSADTENIALDMFGALLTPGDHKARMDMLLYGSDDRSRHCAPPSAWARGDVALAKARIAVTERRRTRSALLDAVPRELHSDPGYHVQQDPAAAPRGEVRRGRAADAGGAARSAPAPQSRRMVDRAAAAGAQAARRRRIPHRLSDRTRCRASRTRHLQDRAGIHRRLDRAALPQRSRDSRAALRPHRRRQRQSDRAGARRLLAGPRRGSRRPQPGSARRLYPRRRAIHQLLRPARARQARPAAARAERRADGRAAALERLEIVRAVQLLYALDEREIAMPMLADLGENGDPEALLGLGELAAAQQRRARHAAGRQGRAQSRPAVRSLRLSRQRHSAASRRSAPRSSAASSMRSRGRKARSTRRSSRRPRPMA